VTSENGFSQFELIVIRAGINGAGISADAAARITRETLGWDAARTDAEIDACRRWVSRYRPRALEPAMTNT
jgi:hypothetical protein